MSTVTQGYLILEDGTEFEGTLFGAIGQKGEKAQKDRGCGEVVFNTSITGYQEILTDPSYYGEIVCMTVPHVGNTGVNAIDPESAKAWCAGFVVHEMCEKPSSWRAQGSLDEFLKTHGIPGISGIDTRALTRYLRTRGVIRGAIVSAADKARAKEVFAATPAFEGRDLIGEVSTKKPYSWPLNGEPKGKTEFKVVAIDFGIKYNQLRSLHHFGCDIEVVPAKTTAEEILARKPDGVFLSNGPGDPSAAPYAHETVRGLVGKLPIFGVCMGHQILSIAMGAKTYKLKFGHRGGNQPVMDRTTQKVEISSHNHGYAVDGSNLPAGIEVTHTNLNDRCIEGIQIPGKKAFSVQYHPEACPGPHDSMALFERFIGMMRG